MLRYIIPLLAIFVVPANLGAVESKAVDYPPVVPGRALSFPKDQGSHPQFRTEWWYVTGHIVTPKGQALGFQVTFFRSRPRVEWANPSRFTPRQLIFAHAALADTSEGRLLHDERSARAGFSLAEAKQGRTHAWIGDWGLEQVDGVYQVRIPTDEFRFEFTLTPTQPILLHGQGGYSRKGSRPSEASYYYSEPQLQVTGTLERQGQRVAVEGEAWLDHEWSSTLLNPEATGWDWVGINLKDGGALMVFRMRTREGDSLWAGGTYRFADGRVRILGPDEVSLLEQRSWVSPRTGISYPVVWEIRIPGLNFTVKPLMDDQELDARASTGTIYWEGAVDARQGDRLIGKGYLEMTGYGEAITFGEYNGQN